MRLQTVGGGSSQWTSLPPPAPPGAFAASLYGSAASMRFSAAAAASAQGTSHAARAHTHTHTQHMTQHATFFFKPADDASTLGLTRFSRVSPRIFVPKWPTLARSLLSTKSPYRESDAPFQVRRHFFHFCQLFKVVKMRSSLTCNSHTKNANFARGWEKNGTNIRCIFGLKVVSLSSL